MNRLSSHVLLRISTTNRQVGKFFARFTKKRKRRENSSACISYLLNRGELQQQRPQLLAQQAHPVNELMELRLAVQQHLRVICRGGTGSNPSIPAIHTRRRCSVVRSCCLLSPIRRRTRARCHPERARVLREPWRGTCFCVLPCRELKPAALRWTPTSRHPSSPADSSRRRGRSRPKNGRSKPPPAP